MKRYKDRDGNELDLPLTVECVQNYIKRHRQDFDLADPDNPANVFRLQELRGELYRDVIFCIRQGAGHAVDLAKEAWKLEFIYVDPNLEKDAGYF